MVQFTRTQNSLELIDNYFKASGQPHINWVIRVVETLRIKIKELIQHELTEEPA